MLHVICQQGFSVIRVAVGPQNEIIFSWLQRLSNRITKCEKPRRSSMSCSKIFTIFISLYVVKKDRHNRNVLGCLSQVLKWKYVKYIIVLSPILYVFVTDILLPSPKQR